MEPEFEDGQIAWVLKQDMVENGEIGILSTTMLVELIPQRVMSWVNAILCISNGFAILLLKETVGLPMEETIKEIEEENMLTDEKDFIPLIEGTQIN